MTNAADKGSERSISKTGRRPGSGSARAIIAAAARRQFSERGYERSTMRSIAAEGGVDPSLLVHFLATKKRLFDEVIDLPFDPVALTASITEAPEGHRGESSPATSSGCCATQRIWRH